MSNDTINSILEQLEHMSQTLTRHEDQLTELFKQAEKRNEQTALELQLPNSIRRVPPKV